LISTPVAFFIFKRPDLTEVVFRAIAQARPKKLMVIADGPRTPEELEKCNQARAVIEKVDWDCEVFTRYSEVNLGCGKNIFDGLNWVFNEAEEAIILEDDMLAAPSFFPFCQALLERYRDDERVMHISGTNVQNRKSPTPYSYYFSKYNHGCAWASWRRAWKHYEFEMKSWQEFKQSGMFKQICEDLYEEAYWYRIFEDVYNNQPWDIWDYQWNYAMWSQGGLAILPSVNLTTNLGFRPDATHTVSDDGNPIANLPRFDLWEIKHPPFVVRHKEADAYTFNYVYGGNAMRAAARPYTLKERIRGRLSLLKNRLLTPQP
jgi:hypothetical protein